MRRFLTVFVVLGAGAVSAWARVDSGLVSLIPANSTMVAGVDVEKCRTSGFGQFLLSKSQSNDPHFKQFMDETGFDPRRDLESILMTSSGDGNGKNSQFAILARGTFDQAKITSLALTKGAVKDVYQGVSLLVNKDHGQSIAFAFPDTDVAVMGDLASIYKVIQGLSAPVTLDVDLTNRIDSAGTANDAWFVSTVGGAALGKQFAAHTGGQLADGQMEGQEQALQSIRAASGGVAFGSLVSVTLDASARSAHDATSLADVFRFLASMVQMNRQADRRADIMASSLDKMQLSTNGDTVHVVFTMSEKNLEQMADLGRAHTY